MTARAGRPRISVFMHAMTIAAAILGMTASAPAGEIADKAAVAEERLQAGEAKAAFEALGEAVASFWDAAPLTLNQAFFVAADGNGIAAKRGEGPFRPGEAARVYLEPLGYGFKDDAGAFAIVLTTGIEIRTPGGLILARAEDFGRLEWKGLVRNRTFNGRIAVDLPDLKEGDYELVLTVTDEATAKTASATLPFAIATE